MAGEDQAERLARIEAVLGGIQTEVAAMREALIRLVRIEEKLSERIKQEDQLAQRLARVEETTVQMLTFLAEARDFPSRVTRIEEQHAGTQDAVRGLATRLERQDERMDELEETIASLRGPLLWLAGIAASVVAGLVSILIGRAL